MLVHALTGSSGNEDRRARPEYQERVPSILVLTGTLFKDLKESSGVAVSRTHDSILWSHNDSGDDPDIYATNLQGDQLGRFRVRRARDGDWEDISLGPCPDPDMPGDCLYIADTGDNDGRRTSVNLYIVPEPQPPENRRKRRRDTRRARRVKLRYPRGRPDVEAMAVGPEGHVLLVSKGRRGPIMLYHIPAEKLSEDSVLVRFAGTLSMPSTRQLGRLVTGAAISPSGRRAVIRTHWELFFYTRTEDGRLIADGPPCFLGAIEPQGEAVDFLDEENLVLLSETLSGRPGTIYRVACPS
jgi:hypothetical protein